MVESIEIKPGPFQHPGRFAGRRYSLFRAREASVGGGSIVAINEDNLLLGAGDNTFGQLSHGDTASAIYLGSRQGTQKVTPSAFITAFSPPDFCMGDGHLLYIDDAGALFGCGKNATGQLGLGHTDPGPTRLGLINRPPLGLIWTHCRASDGFSAAILSHTGPPPWPDGEGLYVWGRNEYGQLGLGDTSDRHEPTHLTTGVKLCALGKDHLIYITTDGRYYATGRNHRGQLGLGDTTDRNEPEKIQIWDDVEESWSDLISGIDALCAAGDAHTITIAGHRIVTWGAGDKGQLGTGGNDDANRPQDVEDDDGAGYVGCGKEHSIYTKWYVSGLPGEPAGDRLFGCGRNTEGQLLDGTTTDRNTFVASEFRPLNPGGITGAGDEIEPARNLFATSLARDQGINFEVRPWPTYAQLHLRFLTTKAVLVIFSRDIDPDTISMRHLDFNYTLNGGELRTFNGIEMDGSNAVRLYLTDQETATGGHEVHLFYCGSLILSAMGSEIKPFKRFPVENNL